MRLAVTFLLFASSTALAEDVIHSSAKNGPLAAIEQTLAEVDAKSQSKEDRKKLNGLAATIAKLGPEVDALIPRLLCAYHSDAIVKEGRRRAANLSAKQLVDQFKNADELGKASLAPIVMYRIRSPKSSDLKMRMTRQAVAKLFHDEIANAETGELRSVMVSGWQKMRSNHNRLSRADADLMFSMLDDPRSGGLSKSLHPSYSVRRSVCDVLRRCNGSVVPHLFEFLKSENEHIRSASLSVLFLRPDSRDSIREHTMRLVNDDSALVRKQVARTLPRLHHPTDEAVATIEAMIRLVNDHDMVVRREAANGMGLLIHLASNAQRLTIARQLLRMYFEHKFWAAPTEAVIAGLEAQDAKGIVQECLPKLQREEGWTVLWKVVAAAGGNGNEALPLLVNRFESCEREDIQLDYAIVLYEVEQDFDRVLPLYLTALNANETRMQAKAAMGLQALQRHAKPALPRLIEMLNKNKKPHIALKTIAAIGPEALEAKSAIEKYRYSKSWGRLVVNALKAIEK